MTRGNHWWNEPPLWAWLVMVAGAVAIAVLLPVALRKGVPAGTEAPRTTAAPAASSAAPSSTAAPSSSAWTSPEEERPPRVVVVGDGDSAGRTAWPVLLEDALDVDVVVAAEVGAGYVTAGADGNTLPDLAAEADLEDTDVVVVFGSRNDGPGLADRVARASDELFDDIGAVAPDAELLVIGPPWFSEPSPAGVRNNRDVIRTAAEEARATFVDPLTEGWFVDRPELLTRNGNPSTEGQAYLAELILPEVEPLLPG